MKIRYFGLLAMLMAFALPVSAADLLGKWTAEFDSPIGVQKYVYEFQKSGEALTGEATFDHSMGKGTVPLKNLKVEGDKVSFDEPLSVDGADITLMFDCREALLGRGEFCFLLEIDQGDELKAHAQGLPHRHSPRNGE